MGIDLVGPEDLVVFPVGGRRLVRSALRDREEREGEEKVEGKAQ